MSGLPDDLVAALQRVRRVETFAGTPQQQSAACRATAILAVAAYRAGWPYTDISAALGITKFALRRRLDTAGLEFARSASAGLDMPSRPVADAAQTEQLDPPDWLTVDDAARLAGVSVVI